MALSAERTGCVVMFVALTASTTLTGREVAAQEVIDGIRLGVVNVQPSVAMTVGVDGNVFNDPDEPKSDMVSVIAPAVEFEMNLGRGRLFGTSRPAYNYFHEYTNQRGLNFGQDLGFERPWNRVTLRASGAFSTARERPAFDVDERVRRQFLSYSIGADVHLTHNTDIRLLGTRGRTNYKEGEVVDDGISATALDRDSDTMSVSLRRAVTSLTTVLVRGEWQRDQFENEPWRNATAFRIMPGVEFSRFALISGTAAVGLRRFAPVTPGLPPFRMMVVQLSLSSVVRGRTQLSWGIDRDVGYSFNVEQPYFLQTSGGVSAAHRLGERWELRGHANTLRLRYLFTFVQAPPTGAAVPPLEPERGRAFGFTVVNHIRPGLMVGFDTRRNVRVGTALGDYGNWQWGSSISYVY
jgi:hypothetical protein